MPDHGWRGRVASSRAVLGAPQLPPEAPWGCGLSVLPQRRTEGQAAAQAGGEGACSPQSFWFSSIICRLEMRGTVALASVPVWVAPGACRDAKSRHPVSDLGTRTGTRAKAARCPRLGRGEAHQPHPVPRQEPSPLSDCCPQDTPHPPVSSWQL